ncbi:MAG TPA: hypothetical protein VFL62_13695 [Bradyrhizobium sp.]|uniref:hypothetical protein n=1 Tax=Bradyrhizobium sp. TaxID=376 RepID=UPI002D80CDD5|nr:hypothetical protein [Bradyrhizobium sp.]HET7887276.1 hypothetical protein [Bradyrhizobium sp.]
MKNAGALLAWSSLAVFAAIVVLVPFVHPPQLLRPEPTRAADRPEEVYDPERCKKVVHDQIFISLGRYVFPMAYAKQQMVVYDPLAERDGNLALKVPDPTDQKGCFGNPLQSLSHAFFTPRILARGGQLASIGRAIALITLYRLDRGKAEPGADRIWMGETLQRDLAASACNRATLHEELPNGMSACRIKPINPPNARQEDWAATYKARPDLYATPMGRPFVVNCGPLLYSSSIGQCDVAYEVKPNLGLSYRLLPYLNKSSEPIDHVIDIDKSIRAAITESIVADYLWPDQSIDRH